MPWRMLCIKGGVDAKMVAIKVTASVPGCLVACSVGTLLAHKMGDTARTAWDKLYKILDDTVIHGIYKVRRSAPDAAVWPGQGAEVSFMHVFDE